MGDAKDDTDLRALEEVKNRLGQIVDALHAEGTCDKFRQWQPAPKPPPALTLAERRQAEFARQKVMADIRRHPARCGGPPQTG